MASPSTALLGVGAAPSSRVPAPVLIAALAVAVVASVLVGGLVRHGPGAEVNVRSTPTVPLATDGPAPRFPSTESASTPAAAPRPAEHFVRDYYAALDARRFAVAWRRLAPGLQVRFGGFATWRRGYARTLASSPESLRVTPAPGGATVALTLRAGDRGACGQTLVRHFAVTWRLARTDAGWRATGADARALSAPAPAAAC